MTNYLQMPKKQHVLALLELHWTYRRIEAGDGCPPGDGESLRPRPSGKCGDDLHRLGPVVPRRLPGRVPNQAEANAAKTFPGSPANPATTFPGSAARRRFAAAPYRGAIAEKLDAGLTLQRIWQDLGEEFGTAPATSP